MCRAKLYRANDRFLRSCAASLLVVFCGANGAQSQDSKLQSAAMAFAEGDIDRARRLLVQAHKENNALPPADAMLANLYLENDQIQQARGALERAVTNSPADPEAYLVLGDLAFRQGRITEADLLFAKSRDLAEKVSGRKRQMQIRALAGLAAVAETRRIWPAAEEHLKRWLALDQQAVGAHTRLGRVLFYRDQPRQAYALFQNLSKIDPRAPRPEINIALLYHERGGQDDAKMARRFMDLAVKKDPHTLITRLAMAQWALELCLIDLAVTHSEAALKLDKNSPEAHQIRGTAALHQQKFAAAQADFQTVLAISPERFSARHLLVFSLIEQSQPRKRDQALAHAQVLVRVGANRPAARIALAYVLHRVGKRKQALTILRQALAESVSNLDSQYFAAKILHESGDDAQARKILTTALSSAACFPWREQAQQLANKIKP